MAALESGKWKVAMVIAIACADAQDLFAASELGRVLPIDH
jgi:hypothetical protein